MKYLLRRYFFMAKAMDGTEIINGCIKVEGIAASIYSKLMQKFPEEKDFWEELYNDEKEHISFLNDVKSLGLTNEVRKMNMLPSKQMIKDALKLSDDVNKKISSAKITLSEALSLTLKMEESIVETYTNKLITSLLSCDNDGSFSSFISNGKSHKDKIKRKIKKTK
jgi:rubrerythrin